MARAKIFGTAMICCVIGTAFQPADVQAGTAAVDVSITFAVAPADLIHNRSIAAATARICNEYKRRIDATWADRTRGPKIRCTSIKAMPLMVTEQSQERLIVRP